MRQMYLSSVLSVYFRVIYKLFSRYCLLSELNNKIYLPITYNLYTYTRVMYITRVYINYCYKHADLAYATSACLILGISNDNVRIFA